MVVVGAINVDLVVDAPRLPRAGETVIGGSLHTYGGGKGANAAVAAARAGAHAVLIGAVGRDQHGDSALAELQSSGVDIAGVERVDGVATGVALIVVSETGENQIAVGAGANMALRAAHVRDVLRRLLPTAGCVLVSAEISPEAVLAAVECAAEAAVPCVLNPAPVVPAVIGAMEHGPLVTPNRTELADLAAALAAGSSASGDSVAAARLVSARTQRPVVVTLGGDGALLVRGSHPPMPVPPYETRVVDTTGAGDTFNGVLAHRLASGDELADALRVASAAASISVSAVGARGGMPEAAAISDRLASADS